MSERWTDELLRSWVNASRDVSQLERWARLIERRVKELSRTREEALLDMYRERFKSWQHREVVWTMMPLDDRMLPPGPPEPVYQARFWHYQPKKEVLWLWVDHPTKYQPRWLKEGGLIPLRKNAWEYYEPSRCERDVRLRNRRRDDERRNASRGR